LAYYKMRGEMWQAAEVADWISMMTEAGACTRPLFSST
jgi:hypothetical protein